MKFAYGVFFFALLSLTVSSRKCILKPKPKPKPCYIGGCLNEVCSSRKDVTTSCEWKEEYSCLYSSTCEHQANGKCGWTQTQNYKQCVQGIESQPVDNSTMNARCFRGGCYDITCADDEELPSSCEWAERNSCFDRGKATCERQADGKCGFTQTEELQQCIIYADNPLNYNPPGEGPCYVGGTAKELCTSRKGVRSDVKWRESFSCFEAAACERQADRRCGWTQTEELQECIYREDNPPADGPCYFLGCSTCTDDKNIVISCDNKDLQDCYQKARCERQNDNYCGWTYTEEWKSCFGAF